MTSPAAAPAATTTVERTVALATTAAPIVTGIVAPWLDSGAALTAAIAYGGAAGFLAANRMNRLPDHLLHNLPAGDIVRAHRSPMFISTVATGMALAVGTLQGATGTDALMAGVLDIPGNPIPGILSFGWWTAVTLVPLKLRTVLSRKTPLAPRAVPPPSGQPAVTLPPTGAEDVLQRWARYISHPTTGQHRGQELTLHTYGPSRWSGTITAPVGSPANVIATTVSTVYQVPARWIELERGAHDGEQHITVNLTKPANIDTSTLTGAWTRWVSRRNGLMAGTHLKNVQPDPNTGGEVALVVAGEDLDRLHHPDRMDLAGALRVTNPLLISYEPRQNPREAVIRKMEHNPLQKGAAFPGVHVLRPNDNGYIQLGPGVSGFPARIQIWDPALGAQHVIVAGVTGSGKGGTLQLLALAHHVNGSAIINADPKGSSNPAIDAMAAHSGLGPDDALGALRIWYHGLQHRVAESARTGMKNFKSSPDRPWVPIILDEASKLLGETAEHRKEATFIINAGATLGRSLGMPVILANQLMQLAQLGGDAAIRDNVFYGGSLILLRSDSQQKHLVDLPENFAGCNPADIPAAWSGERDMVYDPNKPLNDPERTFGLAFTASPAAHAEMMRNWILEDATPYVDQDNIAYPVDWPFWDDREELAQISVLPDDKAAGGDDSPFLFTAPIDIVKKPASADEKIVAVLEEATDPIGLEPVYLHKDQIGHMARLEGSTLDNGLSRLIKTEKIHRQIQDGKTIRGMYGLGPAPVPDTDE